MALQLPGVPDVDYERQAKFEEISKAFPVSNANLLSSNLGVWKTIHTSQVTLVAVAISSQFHYENGGIAAPGTGVAVAADRVYLDEADFDVPGMNTELRTRSTMFRNATAIGASNVLTHGIIDITAVAGGAGIVSHTTGGSVLLPTAYTASAASTRHVATSSTESVSDGSLGAIALPQYFGFITVISGANMAANSAATVSIDLQYRHVAA